MFTQMKVYVRGDGCVCMVRMKFKCSCSHDLIFYTEIVQEVSSNNNLKICISQNYFFLQSVSKQPPNDCCRPFTSSISALVCSLKLPILIYLLVNPKTTVTTIDHPNPTKTRKVILKIGDDCLIRKHCLILFPVFTITLGFI